MLYIQPDSESCLSVGDLPPAPDPRRTRCIIALACVLATRQQSAVWRITVGRFR